MSAPASGADDNSAKVYTADELNAMTVTQIQTLAADLGYDLTATKKSDIIAEFLAQQG